MWVLIELVSQFLGRLANRWSTDMENDEWEEGSARELADDPLDDSLEEHRPIF